MADKDRHKSSKPDLVIPPWEQIDQEAPADDASGESALETPAEADADEAVSSRRKGRYSLRRAGSRGERDGGDVPKTRRGKSGDGDTPKTRRGKSGDGDTPKTRRGGSRNSVSTVVMVDGRKLTTVGFKLGKVASVSDQDYPSEAEALKAAGARRGGKRLLVWCGASTARVARPADTSEHPDVKQLADARYLANVFSPNQPAAMSGNVSMTPAPRGEAAEIVNSSTAPMVVSGMCVDLDKGGLWLRVGRTQAEITLVHEGEITGWTSLGSGLDSVAERIRQGESPERARTELADRVVGETRKAIMQWQRTRTVPPWIWLHGPGGDPSGEMQKALLLHSGCRVAPPQVEEPAAVGLTQHMPLLPTAMHSLSAQRLERPERILQASARIKKQRMVAALALAAVVLGGTALYSANVGHRARVRIAAANAQASEYTLQAEAESTGRALVAQAEQVLPVLELLKGPQMVGDDAEPAPPIPDWEKIFRMKELFSNNDVRLGLQATRYSTTVLATSCCEGIAGYKDLTEELDKWAKIIYGPGARAEGHLSGNETADGSISIAATMIRPE